MKLSNLVQRIITCVVGVPLIAGLIFLLPQNNFIGLSILAMLLALLGSLEMSKILFKEVRVLSCLAWIAVLMEYLSANGEVFMVLLALVSLFIEIKQGEKDNFKASLENSAKNLLSVVYPSFFIVYLIKFLALENTNRYSVLLYLILVFSNDIFAYVFGMLFGRSNAGILKVSPKKSIAGFIGGFLSCIGICFLYTCIFASELPALSVFEKAGLGVCISIFGNAGDLAESVFKRSAGIKDSGNIIPGRGGILDCVDSIVSTAPFIYFVFSGIVK